MSNLTVIVPAYNEAESLRVFLPELLEFCGTNGYRLIIVNDASIDETGDVLVQFEGTPGFSITSHKVNRGYGAAIKSGIANADTEYCITIDADGQHDLADVTKLYQKIKSQDADMIVGDRTAHADASLYRGIGKSLIRLFAGFLLPIHIKDLNSGIRIYRTTLARRYLKLSPDNFAFSDIITMVFISQKHLVLEQPVNIRPRIAGTSTITTVTAVETVREILNIVILFNPMRVFFPIAALSISASLVWGIPISLAGRGVSVGALLAFTTGILFFSLGLIAEQLSQIRKNSVNE